MANIPLNRSKTNAAKLDVREVKQDLRFFIEQYRLGQRETTALVSRTIDAVALVDQKLDHLVGLQEDQVDGDKRERFLQSLKYPRFNERRNQVGDAYGASLKWIFDEDSDDSGDEGETRIGIPTRKWDSLPDWLSSDDTVYWISGHPGSGKTMLVKYMLAHRKTKEYLDKWSPNCEIVSHYFWRPGSRMQKNLEGLFCSLLYQLLGSSSGTSALREVMSSVSSPKDSYTDWSSAELRSALLRTLDSYERACGVCLFLDGLDEINPEDGTKDGIPEFLDLALKLSQRRKIKLCLASRPDPLILKTRLSIYPRLRLQDLNHDDLMDYAKGKIIFPDTYDPEEGDNLIQLLVDKASGVFLWLVLVTKSINQGIENGDGVSAASLWERIEALPWELSKLYHDMWERAGAKSPGSYRMTAALYFKLCLVLQNGTFLDDMCLFHLMLATTPVADEILNTLDKPSKGVHQDVMLQKCREVEKKLNIYCFGLIELGPELPFDELEELAVDLSWYGHIYDNLFPLAVSSELNFIHRTACDFLTDTEPGREILALDTSSGFAIHCRIVKARLAKLALFAEEEERAEWWVYELKVVREAWKGTDEWVPKDWDRLVLFHEKLANIGRLFSAGWPEWGIFRCAGADFLKVMACYDCDDDFIISRLRNGNLSGDDTSEILLNACQHGVRRRTRPGGSYLHAIRELLRAGADPNWQGWIKWVRLGSFPYAALETPWQMYLLSVFRYLLDLAFPSRGPDAPELIRTELALAVDAVNLFILHGAKLDETVIIAIVDRQETFYAESWQEITEVLLRPPMHRCGNPANPLFTSIPAYVIVKILTEIIHSSSSPCGQGTVSDELRQSLEGPCMNHGSSKVCRIFGMMKSYKGQPRQFGDLFIPEQELSWWETTLPDQVQTQLGSRLIEYMNRWFMLSIPVGEGEGDPTARDSAAKVKETIRSIVDDVSWNMMAHTTNATYERFIELGLAIRIDGIHERRRIGKWVKMHVEKSQSM